MLFLSPLVVVMVGYVAYRVWHRQAHPAIGMAGGPSVAAAPHASFWPTTLEGRLGLGALAVRLVMVPLVDVVAVPFLSWIVVVAGLVLSGVARFARHDRSASVLIVLLVTALAVVASLLFVGGEVVIGHE